MKVAKVLTPNDLGLTGAHQAGLHVPKDSPIASFIGPATRREVNPRVTLTLVNPETGLACSVRLIYYNNSLRGGTRDEFRLTGTTAFLRSLGAAAGDELVFDLATVPNVTVSLTRATKVEADGDVPPIKLTGRWRFIGGTT